METSQAVKCLNTSSGGRRRFVFKSFTQRAGEIDINVFRSLDEVKPSPSPGSSFFRDSLLQWRELNTAEDFISLYDELMPLVQTLTQIVLHREKIMSELLRRLTMEAKLSLEPILVLIAALSRDILEEFLPFLEGFTKTSIDLLWSGADRDPEILEQIFTSWSYIIMFLQKYLTKDVVKWLKATVYLRFFPNDYVIKFMAEAISFVLRNSPANQLTRGIRRIIKEVAKSSSQSEVSRILSPDVELGVSELLWHVLRGTSSRLHSRASNVLQLLMNKSTFSITDKYEKGLEAVIQVITSVVERICKEVDHNELDLVYTCLYEEMSSSINAGCLVHFNRILDLLTFTVRQNNKSSVLQSQATIELVRSLIHAYVMPANNAEDDSKVLNGVLELMLCLLDTLLDSFDLSSILVLYAPVFKLRNQSLIRFIKGLLEKGSHIAHMFRTHIISAMGDLIEASPEEVLDIMLTFFEKRGEHQACDTLHGEPEDKILTFFNGELSYWKFKMLKNIATKQSLSKVDVSEKEKEKLAVLWGVLHCYPQLYYRPENMIFITDLIGTLDQLLENEDDTIASLPKSTWHSILAAALSTYHKLLLVGNSTVSQTPFFLRIAKRHKSSPQVMYAVAEFLDSVLGPLTEADATQVVFQELGVQEAVNSINTFSDNLGLPSKSIRISTLRVLSHYPPLDMELSTSDEPPQKKSKTEENGSSNVDSQFINVIELLLSVETTPVSISASRKIVVLFSRLQMGLTSTRIPNVYVPLLLSGIMGILHNRFSYLWEPALQCLSTLISKYKGIVWEKFVHYLGNYLLKFLYSDDQLVKSNFESPPPTKKRREKESQTRRERIKRRRKVTQTEAEIKPQKALNDRFDLFLASDSDSTQYMTVMSLLLQSLHKVPDIAEARSRQIIPLFFEFLGYTNADVASVEFFSCHKRKGKEWRSVLKEWLNLLRLMRNARSLYRSNILKEVLINRLLNETDHDIQLKVVDCLLNWRDDFLIPYDQHLKNLIISKNVREELTTWAVSDASQFIQEEHRACLVPIIIRILTPKVRKSKALGSHKHAGVKRKAVLGFLVQLDVDELRLFFSLLLKPLLPDILESDVLNSLSDKTMAIDKLVWKKKYGFLHVVEDILRTFDGSHIKPFLNPLMGIVVRLLESCKLNPSEEGKLNLSKKGNTGDSEMINSFNQFKMHFLCLEIISLALDKYNSHDFGSDFWDLFYMSVKPLIDNFKQVASRSKTPRSFFSCFIVMSRSRTLVSLLDREKNLVPSIFLILEVKTASYDIISLVLDFIENLLNLDNEPDYHEDDSAKRVFLPHLETLLRSFHIFFRKENHRKSNIGPGEKELRIFKLLVKYINNPLAAGQFLDILLPCFEKKSIGSDECLDALSAIREILPVISDGATIKVLSAMTRLLDSVGLDLRLCICDILDGLAVKDPSLASLAKLVRELNAVSPADIDGIDYATRDDAYKTIGLQLFRQLRVDHALVILSQCVYDMSSEEYTIRQGPLRALQSFAEFAQSFLSRDTEDCQADTVNNSTIWSTACIHQIIKRTFLNNMGKSMGKDISISKEWISLLRHMIRNLHGVAYLNSFRPLCSEDEEVDFFKNIVHFQIHRKRRALARFKNLISAGNFAESITMEIFVPLFFNMLFDVKDGKGEHLRNACVEALASIAAQMKWESYRKILMRCFREMTLKPDKEKILLRLICSVLEGFHFYDENSTQVIKDEIQGYLHKAVLPKIHKFLTSDSERVNVSISLIALKLLKLLPMETLESQLPTIIHRICNFLKNRLGSIRDEARSALAACLKELGVEYLQFIVKVLRGILKRGYELHVLGYTLNFILSKAVPDSGVGKLDYCLEELLSVAVNDIFGDVAEEKEVDKIASKMKETRKSKSFETLKLISQSITFRTHSLKLISSIDAHLQKQLTPKAKTKLEKMLHHIALGFECNPSVEPSELFVFVYGLIQDNITEKESIVEKGSHDNQSQNSYLIAVFALRVLHNRLKNMKLDKNDEQLLSMLDPFVKLLGDCLNSKYEDILSAAFRCLAPLIKLPLPSLEAQADKIKILLLEEIAQGSGNDAGRPLLQSSLKLLSELLRGNKISLSNDQLHLLIRFPLFVDIQTNPCSEALSLLKSIVGRKLVVHEIYDLVMQVAELMVTSHSEPIQRRCREILLLFLLDYRLSDKRLQQHMDFLLSNLSYEHSIGRESVLEMLHAILKKFPESVVDSQAQKFFLHLVVALANERDQKIGSMVATAIKELIERTSQHAMPPLLDYTLSWYMGEKQHLWSAAAQVLSLLIEVLIGKKSLEKGVQRPNVNMSRVSSMVEVLEKGVQKHTENILGVANGILGLSVEAATRIEAGVDNGHAIPYWKEAYYTLVMLQKMLTHFPEISLDKNLEEIWEMIVKFLLHPHILLRNISNHLMNLYFKTNNFNPRRLFAIAVSLVNQLRTSPSDDAGRELMTNNLVSSICGLHSFAKRRSLSSLKPCGQGSYLEAFDLLGSRKAKCAFLLSTNGTDCLGQGDQNDTDHPRHPSLLVEPLIKKMGKLALQLEDIQMRIVFNCFKKISKEIGAEGCQLYAIHMLHPLYKVCEGFSGKVISDEIKQLAEEVRDSIRDVLGVDNFVRLYNGIRKDLKERREKRKEEQKLIAVVNPARNAKRKLSAATKHRAHKKRKIMAMKMGRWLR